MCKKRVLISGLVLLFVKLNVNLFLRVTAFVEGTSATRTAARAFAFFLFNNAVYDYSYTDYNYNRSGYNGRPIHIFTSSFFSETK